MVVAGDTRPVLPKLQTSRQSHEVAHVLQSSRSQASRMSKVTGYQGMDQGWEFKGRKPG